MSSSCSSTCTPHWCYSAFLSRRRFGSSTTGPPTWPSRFFIFRWQKGLPGPSWRRPWAVGGEIRDWFGYRCWSSAGVDGGRAGALTCGGWRPGRGFWGGGGDGGLRRGQGDVGCSGFRPAGWWAIFYCVTAGFYCAGFCFGAIILKMLNILCLYQYFFLKLCTKINIPRT